MCNCINEIAKTTIEHLKSSTEGEISGDHITGIQYSFKAKTPPKTSSSFEFLHAPLKKDGTIGKPKKSSIALMHNYCPWCGEKHPES